MYMHMCMCMCPKISRRSAPGTHQKQSKRPTFPPGRDPGDSPPVTSQISPHIFNMSLQPCFAAWQAARGPHEPY